METLAEVRKKYPDIVFKSYYVVWKLSEGMQQAEARQKFKSYYVVWKQNAEIDKAFEVAERLNRTM